MRRRMDASARDEAEDGVLRRACLACGTPPLHLTLTLTLSSVPAVWHAAIVQSSASHSFTAPLALTWLGLG